MPGASIFRRRTFGSAAEWADGRRLRRLGWLRIHTRQGAKIDQQLLFSQSVRIVRDFIKQPPREQALQFAHDGHGLFIHYLILSIWDLAPRGARRICPRLRFRIGAGDLFTPTVGNVADWKMIYEWMKAKGLLDFSADVDHHPR